VFVRTADGERQVGPVTDLGDLVGLGELVAAAEEHPRGVR